MARCFGSSSTRTVQNLLDIANNATSTRNILEASKVGTPLYSEHFRCMVPMVSTIKKFRCINFSRHSSYTCLTIEQRIYIPKTLFVPLIWSLLANTDIECFYSEHVHLWRQLDLFPDHRPTFCHLWYMYESAILSAAAQSKFNIVMHVHKMVVARSWY